MIIASNAEVRSQITWALLLFLEMAWTVLVLNFSMYFLKLAYQFIQALDVVLVVTILRP